MSKPLTPKPLTPQQARFVAEYLKDLNGKQAAIRAGYSVTNAKEQASRLLTKANVKAAVAERQQKHFEAIDFKAQDVLRAIARHVFADARADVRDLFDAHGDLRQLTELSVDAAMHVGGFEVVKRNLTAGDGVVETIYKVKLRDQSRYVEMGARHFKLLTDILKVEGDWDKKAARLAAARQRIAKKAARGG